ncbi:MAG: nuclear transport factor 2 family protein [Acidobacteriota bacterium]|nr:MAG: nuclear transport factor 2 family protein [Acidobacteriota bacterium]
MKLVIGCVLGLSVVFSVVPADSEQKKKAENFFSGLYGCRPEVVDKLGAKDIVVSYPIFERIFKKRSITGKDEVRGFAERFCSRWTNATVRVDHAVEEGNTVVLMWSFSAVSAVDAEGMPPKGTSSSWGGISLFRFDEDGRIALEVGEESTPGPAARLAGGPPDDGNG